MLLKLRRVFIALLGVGGMVIGLFTVTISGRFTEPFNLLFIVVGILVSVSGGLVFGVVAVAWMMRRAMEWSEAPHWGRSRGR